MKITGQDSHFYIIKIEHNGEISEIKFSPQTKELIFNDDNKLTKLLKRNEYQFRKILHIKRPETYFIGFELKFVLRDNKNIEDFNNRTKILVLDRRNGKYKNYVTDKGKKKISKLFTDASFLSKYNSSGYVVIIQDTDGNYITKSVKSKINNSCLLELLAAIKGLLILKNIKNISIVTDSQYVRKGLTECIVNWKLNNWHTANGTKVKHIRYWKLFDALSDNKYIEFEWVKSHSGHFENEMCDLLAKETAMNLYNEKFSNKEFN